MITCQYCGKMYDTVAGATHYCPNFPPPVTWQPAYSIRLFEKVITVTDMVSRKEKILQQAWISSDGQVTWRDVPTVTE